MSICQARVVPHLISAALAASVAAGCGGGATPTVAPADGAPGRTAQAASQPSAPTASPVSCGREFPYAKRSDVLFVSPGVGFGLNGAAAGSRMQSGSIGNGHFVSKAGLFIRGTAQVQLSIPGQLQSVVRLHGWDGTTADRTTMTSAPTRRSVTGRPFPASSSTPAVTAYACGPLDPASQITAW
jgi:hypothetical protein